MKRHIPPTPSYRFSTGKHPAIETIHDGATIEPSMVDADGLGKDLKRLPARHFDWAQGQPFPGNPLLGPYFVQSASKGDAVVVDIISLRADREIARTLIKDGHGYWEAPALPHKRRKCRTRLIKWKTTPKSATPLNPFGKTFPPVSCRPFLGCIATATAGKGKSSLLASDHGGNLDLPILTAGTSLALPVYCEGALVYFGDMHAAQGAGEIVGGGLEISGSAKLRCRIRQGEAQYGLRFKHKTAAGTIAVKRNMEAAVKQSFSNLVAWLVTLGMEMEDAVMLLSQTCAFEMGGLSSRYSVVACTLAKPYWPTSDFNHLL